MLYLLLGNSKVFDLMIYLSEAIEGVLLELSEYCFAHDNVWILLFDSGLVVMG